MKIATKVKDVMDKNVVMVDANTSVFEAVKTMLQKKVWSVVVVERGLPVGVVVDHDVLNKCVGAGLDVNRVKTKEIMSAPLMLIDAEAAIGEALSRMLEKEVRRLYIVENGKLVGRITERKALEASLNVMMSLSSVQSVT